MIRSLALTLLVVAPAAAFVLPVAAQPPSGRLSKTSARHFVTAAASATTVDADGPLRGGKWTDKLNKVSTFASVLCAIDCTVFPVLLALLPLINVAGPSSAWLHKAAHAVALYFVAPVGGAAVLSNAAQHRKPLVLGWGLSGVALVLLANIHLPHALEHLLPPAVDRFLHARHSLINVMGCALLLSSQWYSHRLLEAAGKCCGGHGHDHHH